MHVIKCRRCGIVNDPTRRVCSQCGLLLLGSSVDDSVCSLSESLVKISPEEYSVPIDNAVIRELNSLPVLPNLVSSVIQYWNTPITRAQLLGNGIKLSATQGTSIFKIAEECGRLLGVPIPEIFVKQDPTYNAYTLGSNEEHVIVLHSALVDDYSEKELQFVIGHEMGHIKSKHVVYHTLAEFLNKGIGLIFKMVAAPVRLAINKWVRESELTADRAGLLCVGELEPAVYGLVRLAVGSEKVLQEFNLAEYLNQSKAIDNFYAKINILLQDHPYVVNRVVSLGEFVTSNQGKRTLERLQLYRKKDSLLQDSQNLPLRERLALEEVESIFCKSCGFKVEQGMHECIMCGQKL